MHAFKTGNPELQKGAPSVFCLSFDVLNQEEVKQLGFLLYRQFGEC